MEKLKQENGERNEKNRNTKEVAIKHSWQFFSPSLLRFARCSAVRLHGYYCAAAANIVYFRLWQKGKRQRNKQKKKIRNKEFCVCVCACDWDCCRLPLFYAVPLDGRGRHNRKIHWKRWLWLTITKNINPFFVNRKCDSPVNRRPTRERQIRTLRDFVCGTHWCSRQQWTIVQYAIDFFSVWIEISRRTTADYCRIVSPRGQTNDTIYTISNMELPKEWKEPKMKCSTIRHYIDTNTKYIENENRETIFL